MLKSSTLIIDFLRENPDTDPFYLFELVYPNCPDPTVFPVIDLICDFETCRQRLLLIAEMFQTNPKVMKRYFCSHIRVSTGKRTKSGWHIIHKTNIYTKDFENFDEGQYIHKGFH